MTIRRNHKYYIDEYKTFNEYLKEFMNIVKDKKIKSLFSIIMQERPKDKRISLRRNRL